MQLMQQVTNLSCQLKYQRVILKLEWISHITDGNNSLANPSKDRQQFVDTILLISAPDWSKMVSNFEVVVVTPFEFDHRTSNYVRFCQTVKVAIIFSLNHPVKLNISKCAGAIIHKENRHVRLNDFNCFVTISITGTFTTSCSLFDIFGNVFSCF